MEKTETKNTNSVGLVTLQRLLNFYGFNNHMTVKEVKEEIMEKLWINQYGVRFKTFNVVDKDILIGKITVAYHYYIELGSEEDEIYPENKHLIAAFTFCDISREKYSKKEGEKFALHRLLCTASDVVANSKYTKLENDFIKNVPMVLPFQADIDVTNIKSMTEQIKLLKEAAIKSANSMGIVWMLGMTVENLK